MTTFNPLREAKQKHKLLIKQEMRRKGIEIDLEDDISFSLTIYIPTPNSWSKKRKEESLGLPCPTRPDLDNYIKFYADVLSEIAYIDDGQISTITARKVYAKEARVEIEILPDTQSKIEVDKLQPVEIIEITNG